MGRRLTAVAAVLVALAASLFTTSPAGAADLQDALIIALRPQDGPLVTVRNLKAKGVHVYPIASSDTDDTAEYQMRSTAQLTGGRYVFLTNDSGVGNSHAEPHIPCYAVTRLDSAIIRAIDTELTGQRHEAPSEEVIRNVGQPDKTGKCKLASGALVASF